MKKIKEGRYTYYIIPERNIVKCISTYAKIPYAGVAKCNDADIFNEDTGKYIARVRCDAKINKVRIKTLKADMDVAFENIQWWSHYHGKLCSLMKKAEKEKRDLIFEIKKTREI